MLDWLRALAARFRRANDGAAIVELAIMAPLLLVFSLGTIEIGRYLYEAIEVGNATRAGVQYGGLGLAYAGTNSEVISAVQADAGQINIASGNIMPSTYCTCNSDHSTHLSDCSPQGTSCKPPDYLVNFISVTVDQPFDSLFNYPGLPATIEIKRTMTQQISP